VLVGIGCAYWALIIFDKRMRKCPHCHQTGGGDITESTLIGSKNYMDFKHQPPIRVTVKSYEEHYQCQYCGHTWIRTAEETVRFSHFSKKSFKAIFDKTRMWQRRDSV
jgi:hypothetical protein